MLLLYGPQEHDQPLDSNKIRARCRRYLAWTLAHDIEFLKNRQSRAELDALFTSTDLNSPVHDPQIAEVMRRFLGRDPEVVSAQEAASDRVHYESHIAGTLQHLQWLASDPRLREENALLDQKRCQDNRLPKIQQLLADSNRVPSTIKRVGHGIYEQRWHKGSHHVHGSVFGDVVFSSSTEILPRFVETSDDLQTEALALSNELHVAMLCLWRIAPALLGGQAA